MLEVPREFKENDIFIVLLWLIMLMYCQSLSSENLRFWHMEQIQKTAAHIQLTLSNRTAMVATPNIIKTDCSQQIFFELDNIVY